MLHQIGKTKYSYQIFVPDAEEQWKEVDALTPEQQHRAVEAMGRKLNERFGLNPRMYLAACREYDARRAESAAT